MTNEPELERGGEPRWLALPAAIALTAAVAVALFAGLSLRETSPKAPFLALGGLYLLVAVPAFLRYKRRDEIHLIKPRGGDLTIGALVAFLLFGLAYATNALFTSPGTPHHGWIIRIYLLLGDPFSESRHFIAAGVALVGLLEELAWRGYVTPLCESKLGVLRGNVVSVVLYAVAHVPAMFLLADPVAGPNPLLPVAALGCGAAWSYLRWRMERMPPVLASHALFSWMIVEFPLWS